MDMRVLRIYPFLPPNPGGMEMHVLRLTQEQRRLGYAVRVAFHSGARTHESDLAVKIFRGLRSVRPQAVRDVVFYFALAWRIVLSRLRFDVVHVHGDWAAFALGILVARLSGAPCRVASVHGALRGGAIADRVYQRALRLYNIVYCTGAKDAERLRGLGLRQARWQNSGIDPAFYLEESVGPADQQIDIVCVANFFPVKNLRLAVDIARQLPRASFLLIGDGPQREELERTCAEEGVANVRFAGRLSQECVVGELRRSKIFLSTSLTEGTPTALLEAMAAGLPVVTSHSNDFRGLVVEGVNGYVVEGFEPSPYAQRLQALLSSEGARAKIAAANRSQALAHAWPTVARRISGWMTEILRECRP